MRDLPTEAAKAIYRVAIDELAADTEGTAWWEEVRVELIQVLAARTVAEAATLIGWWHNDWTAINDTARAAAKRLRQAAKTFNRAAGTPVSSAPEPGQATYLRT
jgi:hypothetical protein